MKILEELQKEIQNESTLMSKSVIISNVGKHLKKLIFITSLAGVGLFLNACDVGYVATEPTYVESVRPNRPSDLHVWIDGDWSYNRHSHGYVHNNGYWEKPVQGRTYMSGHWQGSQKGKYWVKGRYQRQGR